MRSNPIDGLYGEVTSPETFLDGDVNSHANYYAVGQSKNGPFGKGYRHPPPLPPHPPTHTCTPALALAPGTEK